MKASEEDLQKKRLEKKRKLRERFDEEYDEGDAAYLDVLKEEVQKQGEVGDQPPQQQHGPVLGTREGDDLLFPSAQQGRV